MLVQAMTDSPEQVSVDLPRVYLIRMMVFILVVALLVAILFPTIRSSFMHNPGLNGFIALVLLFGIAHAFRQVVRLFPEVNWINSFRIADPGLEIPHQPRLLAPMASLLRDRQTNQAQNRFYNDLENWLSSITDIEAGEGAGAMSVPHYLRLDLRDLQSGIERINKTLTDALTDASAQAQVSHE